MTDQKTSTEIISKTAHSADEKSKTRHSKRFDWFIPVIVLVGMITVGLLASFIVKYLGDVDIRWSPRVIAPAIEVTIATILFAYVSWAGERNETTRWFLLLVLALDIAALGSMCQALLTNSVTLSTAAGIIGYCGFSLIPVALTMFTLTYTRSSRSNSLFVQIVLFGSWILICLVNSTTILFDSVAFLATTGNNQASPGQTIGVLWTEIQFLGAAIMLFSYMRSLKPSREKLQARLFFRAVFAARLGAIPIVIFGALLNISVNVNDVLAFVMALITLVLAYGIYRYGIFTLNPFNVTTKILSTLNEAVLGIAMDHTIQFHNPAAQLLFREEHLTGKSVLEYLDKPSADTVQKAFTERLKHNMQVHNLELELHHNRDAIPIEFKANPITDRNQVPQGVVAVFRDITAEKMATQVIEQKVVERTEELQRERIRLEASINSLNVGFVMTDMNHNIVTINGLAKQMLLTIGKKDTSEAADTSDSALETSLKSWTLDNISQQLQPMFDLGDQIDGVLRERKRVDVSDLEYQSRILRIFIAPIIGSNNHESQELGAIVLFDDITEERVLNRSKEEFFSIASHELRTPLTAIRGNTSMIKQYYGELLTDPSLVQMIDDIHNSSVRLIEIVNDFLDASRLEQGKMEFKTAPFAIEKVIESVMYEMGAVMNEKSLYLKMDKTLDVLPLVLADPDRVKQVIYNLVGNALKFTEKGGITIRTELVQDSGNGLIKVCVDDSGRGIPADKQSLLFRKFQQAGSSLLTRDTTRGTGLGLYISRLLVERMGGKLLLEKSTEGVGTTFSFTVPMAPKDATVSVENIATTTSLHSVAKIPEPAHTLSPEKERD